MAYSGTVSQALENVLRLLLAGALGAVIGLERERSDQPAGLRTNLLVALGACLFTLLSVYGASGILDQVPGPGRFDPSRIASQIVVGIGFLGAGAILKHGLSIRGLTTAAGLWVVAAVGMAVGFGNYALAGTATVATVVALFALRPARSWVRQLAGARRELVVETAGPADLAAVFDEVKRAGGERVTAQVESGEGEGRVLTMSARFPPKRELDDLVTRIASLDGVRAVETSE